MNSLPQTVTRQRRDCDLNPGPTAPESSTLTTRLPIHPRLPVSGEIHPVNFCASVSRKNAASVRFSPSIRRPKDLLSLNEFCTFDD